MSEENVEVIRAGYAAWAKRDLDTWLETLHPEVEFQTSGVFPDLAPTYRGHRGMRSFWEAMLAPWESFRLEVERIVECDECAAVALRFRAQGKGSGVHTDLRQGHALRFEDGRVVKVSAHASFQEALEAAGLDEEAMSKENVEIVREIYRPWERGDFSSNEWADPEIEFHIRAGPDEAVHHGVEAMGHAWREWLGAWHDLKTEAREFIDLGDDVLVLGEFRGRGKTSGMPIEGMAGAVLFSLRDGKVVRLGTYTDLAEALEAAGLSE